MEINPGICAKAPQRAPPLRPYQEDALRRMKAYEGQAALSVIATGLGKTRIFTDYIRWDYLQNDHRILILSHREELVKQPLTYLSDLPCGIELGNLHAHDEPIISASVQSLVGRLNSYNPYSIDTIIIDEAHHSAAPTYRKIFDYFPNAVRFGFTATAVRGDGIGLDVAFDDILCEYNTLYGISHGYLCPINFMPRKFLIQFPPGLKSRKDKRKKQVCSTLYPVCTPVSVIKKIAFFQKVWYDCGTH